VNVRIVTLLVGIGGVLSEILAFYSTFLQYLVVFGSATNPISLCSLLLMLLLLLLLLGRRSSNKPKALLCHFKSDRDESYQNCSSIKLADPDTVGLGENCKRCGKLGSGVCASAGSRGRAPGQGVWAKPPEAESFSLDK